jgi:hypothetical protein
VSTTTAGIVLVVSPDDKRGAELGLAGEDWLAGESAESGRSAEPHWPQKLLPSGLSCPQFLQYGMSFVLLTGGARHTAYRLDLNLSWRV